MAESEYVASGHIPFLPDNRFHNPAYGLYRFSNVSFESPYITQNRYKLYCCQCPIFTSISTGVEYFVLLIYSNLSVAVSQLFAGSSSRDSKLSFQ